MHITYRSRSLLDFETGPLGARRGVGFVELMFELRVRTVPLVPPPAPPGHVATVRPIVVSNFHGAVTLHVGSTEHYLGTATASAFETMTVDQHVGTGYIHPRLTLSPLSLETLEALRNGGEMALALDLGMEINADGGRHPGRTTVRFEVHQKQWLDILRSVRYANVYLFEIPVHQDLESTRWPAIKGRLDKAQKHLRQGEHADCVAECRMLLELIPTVFPAEDIGTRANEKYRDKSATRQAMTKHEREVVFREALKNFTNMAHHATSSHDIETFTRADATFILNSVIGLLGKYADQYP